MRILFNHVENLSINDIYSSMKILKIKQLRDFIVITNNFFHSKFTIKSALKSDYFRKTTVKFQTPEWRNEYGKRNREYYVPSILNSLSPRFADIDKIGILKKELKTKFILGR